MAPNTKDLRPELTRLAASLGVEPRWASVPSAPQYRYIDEIEIVVSGTKVVIRARTGSKGALLGATFTIETSTPLIATPVTMRRENAIDRLGKNLFINREFQFGDEAFDGAVYIESDASDVSLQRLLSSLSVRVAIANLVAGVAENVVFATLIELGAKPDPERIQRSISVSVPVSKFGQRDAILMMMQTLVQLGQAAERERRPAPLEPAPPRDGWAVIAALVLGLSTWLATWALAVFVATAPTIGWRAYERGMSFAVACWVGVVALSIALFRGRSTSFRTVVILAILWLGLLPLSGSIAQRLNARWDRGPRTSLVGTAHVTYGSKSGLRKHVSVPSVGSDIYVPDEIVDGRLALTTTPAPVRVVVGDGAFGSKWITAVQRIEP